MRDKVDRKEWMKDFNDFMNAEEIQPPAHLFEQIRSIVHRDLNPSAWLVLSKLALIQAVVGSLSLVICAQFGVGPGQHLAMAFARLGDNMCMALCGALFLGLSGLTASLVLKTPEVNLIRKTGYLPILVVGILSLGVFLGFGAEIVVSFAFLWLLGGFIGGLLATEAGWRLRTQLVR